MDSDAALVDAFSKISKMFIDAKENPQNEWLSHLSEDLDDHLLTARTHIQEAVEQKQAIRPTFTLMSNTGVVCPMLFDNMPQEEEQLKLMVMFSALFNSAPIDCYSCMFEAWMGEHHVDEKIIQPSLNPNRKEVVIIKVCNRTDARFGAFEIITHENGNRILSEKSMIGSSSNQKAFNPLMENMFIVGEKIIKNRSGVKLP